VSWRCAPHKDSRIGSRLSSLERPVAQLRSTGFPQPHGPHCQRSAFQANVSRMSVVEHDAQPTPPNQLALAQDAFRRFHARCFWFMRADAEITKEDIPYVCERLRADGGREGFLLAAELCR